MMRVWSRVALVALMGYGAATAGCCRQPATDVLVLNNTPARIKVTLSTAPDEEPVIIAPGMVGLLLSAPQMSTVTIADEASGRVLKTAEVEFRFQDSGLMTAAPKTCAVIANYTEQYGERSGQLTAVVKVGPADGAGRVERHEMTLLLGPSDTMPEELNEFATIHRLVEVPCALISDDAALGHHLAHLK